jgi:hypothetical protein
MQMKRAAGKPRRGRGLQKRLGAFWKWLERDARTRLRRRRAPCWWVLRRSSFLFLLRCASPEKNQQAHGRATSRLFAAISVAL